MGYFNKPNADLTLLRNLLVGLQAKIGAFGVGDIRRSVWILTKMRKSVYGLIRNSADEDGGESNSEEILDEIGDILEKVSSKPASFLLLLLALRTH